MVKVMHRPPIAAINWKGKTGRGGIGRLDTTRQRLSHLRAEAPGAAAQARAIGGALYYGARTGWFSDPAACFEALLDDLRRAERRIWLSVPSICPGVMWETVLTVLRRKAARGVDVRLLWDGRRSRLPINYVNHLRFMRIRSRALYRGKPFRAILIDDGLLYFGELRIGDGQIGLRSRLGDCRAGVLRLRGSAAEAVCGRFLSHFSDGLSAPEVRPSREYGYVCWTRDPSGAARNLILRAEHSVCLLAPRLTGPLRGALTLSAASGVAVHAVVGRLPRRAPPGVELLRFPGRVQGLACCADGQTALISGGREGLWLHGRGAAEIESDLRNIPGLNAAASGYTLQA